MSQLTDLQPALMKIMTDSYDQGRKDAIESLIEALKPFGDDRQFTVSEIIELLTAAGK